MARQFSHTQKNMFNRCPKSFYFRYIRGLKQRPAAAPMVGSKGHDTLATHFRQIIEEPEGEGMSPEEFSAHWEEGFESERKTPDMDWGTVTAGEYKDQFMGTKTRKGIMPELREHFTPKLHPKKVEEKFDLPIPGTKDNIIGYIDFWGQAPGGILTVRDFKFKKKNFFLAKKGVTPKEVVFDDQLTLYDLATRKKGRKVDMVSMDVFVHGLKTENQITSYPMKRTREDRIRIMTEFKEMSHRVAIYGDDPELYPFCHRESSQPFPCSEQWCGFWKLCVRGGGDYSEK